MGIKTLVKKGGGKKREGLRLFSDVMLNLLRKGFLDKLTVL